MARKFIGHDMKFPKIIQSELGFSDINDVVCLDHRAVLLFKPKKLAWEVKRYLEWLGHLIIMKQLIKVLSSIISITVIIITIITNIILLIMYFYPFIGPLVGLEINGSNSVKICRQSIDSNNNKSIYLSPSSDRATQEIDQFYNFVDMSMT